MSIFNYDILKMNFAEVNLPIFGQTCNKEKLIIDQGYSKNNRHFYKITIINNDKTSIKRIYAH